ncbi:MAG: hypothetical protein OXH75_21270 [Acidobacteria bacterium]|nr:hypothetical protein [Acidobacteriota bacterium]
MKTPRAALVIGALLAAGLILVAGRDGEDAEPEPREPVLIASPGFPVVGHRYTGSTTTHVNVVAAPTDAGGVAMVEYRRVEEDPR